MEENKDKKVIGTYEPTDEEAELLEKWRKKFDRVQRYRKPFQSKFLRMYKLYRSYKARTSYAYQTKLMPPIGFNNLKTDRWH